MEKRALIVGSGGQLGVELVREFTQRGYQVAGFQRSELDITDAARVEHTVASFDPAVVLNAAAYNQVDLAEQEPQAAFLANSLAVRNLAMACRQNDALLVHFSTDYVFDGAKGAPYTESDPTHPLGAYAVSKLAGELYAQAYLDKVIIIRTSGVFGPGGLRTARGNFIELMLRLAKENQVIRVVEDHVASPTYAPVLAARSADLVERGVRGLFHIGGGTPISWYDYAGLIFRLAGLKPELRATNEREYRTAARRPKYSALSNRLIESLGLEPFPPLEVAVRSYLQLRQRYVSS
ncbi:MAG: dTDP-4-dehydrorhamnose reductase [Bryobacteraceae bacterium]|nr:dTDP-4-dehydrorhamnose reductase [Bryobacteraceae bacterium]MDW8380436.1 dTDP-4-dehydrorhamnose reductase [Bryobacterales bacterium]